MHLIYFCYIIYPIVFVDLKSYKAHINSHLFAVEIIGKFSSFSHDFITACDYEYKKFC